MKTKQKAIFLSMAFICSNLLCPQVYAVDLKLIDGKVIEKAEIKGIADGKIKWSNPTGMGIVLVSQLADESLSELGLGNSSSLSEEDKKKRIRVQNFEALKKEAKEIKLTNFTAVNSNKFEGFDDLSIAVKNDSGSTKISLSLFPDDVLQLLQWSRLEVENSQKKEATRVWAVSEMQKEWHRREALKKIIKESKDELLVHLASWYTNVFQEMDAHMFESPGSSVVMASDNGDGSVISKTKESGYGSIGYLSFTIEGDGVDPKYFEDIGRVVGADRIIVVAGQKDKDQIVQITKTLYPGLKETTAISSSLTLGAGVAAANTTAKDSDGKKIGSIRTEAEVLTAETTNKTTKVVTQESATRTVEDTVVKVSEHKYDVIYLRKLRK
jgi:hypothetical protein